MPGVSTITYTIQVFNQGDVPASNVTVVDYMPAGLSFDPALNPTWSADGSTPDDVIAGPIQPGQSATVQIVLRLAAGTNGQAITNAAEIAGDNQPPGSDVDSTPDSNNNETPVKDDVIDEDGKNNPGQDEDDHDIAVITVETFDLALRKRLASQSDTPLVPGVSTVTFAIEVFNQGDTAATNVTVIDYVPTGLIFDPALNPTWSAAANPTTVIAGPIQPGQSATVQIVLRVAAARPARPSSTRPRSPTTMRPPVLTWTRRRIATTTRRR